MIYHTDIFLNVINICFEPWLSVLRERVFIRKEMGPWGVIRNVFSPSQFVYFWDLALHDHWSLPGESGLCTDMYNVSWESARHCSSESEGEQSCMF